MNYHAFIYPTNIYLVSALWWALCTCGVSVVENSFAHGPCPHGSSWPEGEMCNFTNQSHCSIADKHERQEVLEEFVRRGFDPVQRYWKFQGIAHLH